MITKAKNIIYANIYKTESQVFFKLINHYNIAPRIFIITDIDNHNERDLQK